MCLGWKSLHSFLCSIIHLVKKYIQVIISVPRETYVVSFRTASHETKFQFHLLFCSWGVEKHRCVNYPSCVCMYAKVHSYLWFNKALRFCCQCHMQEPACIVPQAHMLFRLPLHTPGLQMLLSEFPKLPTMTLPEHCFMLQTFSFLLTNTALDPNSLISAHSASQYKRLIPANKHE